MTTGRRLTNSGGQKLKVRAVLPPTSSKDSAATTLPINPETSKDIPTEKRRHSTGSSSLTDKDIADQSLPPLPRHDKHSRSHAVPPRVRTPVPAQPSEPATENNRVSFEEKPQDYSFLLEQESNTDHIPDVSTFAQESFEPRVLEQLAKIDLKVQRLQTRYLQDKCQLLKKLEKEKVELSQYRSRILLSQSSTSPDALHSKSRATAFWLKALLNNQLCKILITKKDMAAMQYLIHVEVTFQNQEPELETFTVCFEFVDNPFFENHLLQKTFTVRTGRDTERTELLAVEGTKIRWKPDHNLTKSCVRVVERNLGNMEKRISKKYADRVSFFEFFSNIRILSDEELKNLPQSDMDYYYLRFAGDFELACLLRNRIIPDAVSWFNGTAVDPAAQSDVSSDSDEENSNSEDDISDSDVEYYPFPGTTVDPVLDILGLSPYFQD